MRFTRDEHMARMRTYDKLTIVSSIATALACIAACLDVLTLATHQLMYTAISMLLTAISLTYSGIVFIRLRTLREGWQSI